jgi:hypothetical protein
MPARPPIRLEVAEEGTFEGYATRLNFTGDATLSVSGTTATIDVTGGGGGGTPSDANPAPTGTAAPGVSTDYSRADHVHALAAASTIATSLTVPLVQAAATGTLSLKGQAADGAAAVGAVIDNTAALSTSGAKIASFRNNAVEKAFVDKDGLANVAALTTAGVITSSVASGSNWTAITTGARLKVGGGTTDYFVSDGSTTISSPGVFTVTGAITGGTIAAAGVGNIQTNGNFQPAANNNSLSIRGRAADGASAVGTIIDNLNALSNATAKLVSFRNSTAEVAALHQSGALYYKRTDTTADTDGSVTSDTPAGIGVVPNGTSTLTVSCSAVTAASIIWAVLQAAEAGVSVSSIVPGAGTFTINLSGNTTANRQIAWCVIKTI